LTTSAKLEPEKDVSKTFNHPFQFFGKKTIATKTKAGGIVEHSDTKASESTTIEGIPVKPNNSDSIKTQLIHPSNDWNNKPSSIPPQFLGPHHPTDLKGTPTIRVPYSQFLEEDLAAQEKTVSEVAMASAIAYDDSDDYHPIIDGVESGISFEAIHEAILETEKGTIVITDTSASFNKSSLIDVEKKIRPINVDKLPINKAHQEPKLKYPFVAGVAIEDAAKALFLGENPINISPNFFC
jgi:hypothetical protein